MKTKSAYSIGRTLADNNLSRSINKDDMKRIPFFLHDSIISMNIIIGWCACVHAGESKYNVTTQKQYSSIKSLTNMTTLKDYRTDLQFLQDFTLVKIYPKTSQAIETETSNVNGCSAPHASFYIVWSHRF